MFLAREGDYYFFEMFTHLVGTMLKSDPCCYSSMDLLLCMCLDCRNGKNIPGRKLGMNSLLKLNVEPAIIQLLPQMTSSCPSSPDVMLIEEEQDLERNMQESSEREMELFLHRSAKHEIVCTDKIVRMDLEDGVRSINDLVINSRLSDLGSGSFSNFQVASCKNLPGLQYAVKSMSKRKSLTSGTLFRKSGNPFLNIERETSILKKLNHPSIVTLFEILDDQEEDLIYFVFEFMEMGCILTIPTEYPLTEDVATRYFRDVLCGVEYLHSKFIIHRDLKPENMLLNTFGRVKLIDFGSSFCYENGDDRTRLPDGTPSFTAPECLDEDLPAGYSGKAMDMWALGITLFALVFGQVPFSENQLFELYRMIQEDPLIMPNNNSFLPLSQLVSKNMRSLIKRILVKDRILRLNLKAIMGDTVFIHKNRLNFAPL